MSAGGSPLELVTSTQPAAPAPPTVAPAPAAAPVESGVAGAQPSPAAEAPNPPEAPAGRADTSKPPNRADAAKLHRCCVELEDLGKKRGQDGSGISGLSGLCEEWVADLEHGRRVEIDSSTWEEIRLLLNGVSITRGCRDRIFLYEKP
jgi:hypothetical protein